MSLISEETPRLRSVVDRQTGHPLMARSPIGAAPRRSNFDDNKRKFLDRHELLTRTFNSDGVHSAFEGAFATTEADDEMSRLTQLQKTALEAHSRNYLRLNKETLVMGATTSRATRKYREFVADKAQPVDVVRARSTTPSSRAKKIAALPDIAFAEPRKANACSEDMELIVKHAFRRDWVAQAQSKHDREEERRRRQILRSHHSAGRMAASRSRSTSAMAGATSPARNDSPGADNGAAAVGGSEQDPKHASAYLAEPPSDGAKTLFYPQDRKRKPFRPTGYLQETPTVMYARRLRAVEQQRREEEQLLATRLAIKDRNMPDTIHRTQFRSPSSLSM